MRLFVVCVDGGVVVGGGKRDRGGLGFGRNGRIGIGIVGGILFEQGHASLVNGMRGLLTDCWSARLVVVGSPWRVNSDNTSCRTFTETRVQREHLDYSNRSQTVSNANLTHITAMFHDLKSCGARRCGRQIPLAVAHLLTCLLWTTSGPRGVTLMSLPRGKLRGASSATRLTKETTPGRALRIGASIAL